MLELISQTPPLIALALGFFMGIALKRGRVSIILDKVLPGEQK